MVADEPYTDYVDTMWTRRTMANRGCYEDQQSILLHILFLC